MLLRDKDAEIKDELTANIQGLMDEFELDAVFQLCSIIKGNEAGTIICESKDVIDSSGYLQILTHTIVAMLEKVNCYDIKTADAILVIEAVLKNYIEAALKKL